MPSSASAAGPALPEMLESAIVGAQCLNRCVTRTRVTESRSQCNHGQDFRRAGIKWRVGASPCHAEASVLGRQDLPGEVVIPLVVVQVSAVPFDFATLRIDGVGTEVLFGRNEVAREIVV